jgi:hypothetical protein
LEEDLVLIKTCGRREVSTLGPTDFGSVERLIALQQPYEWALPSANPGGNSEWKRYSFPDYLDEITDAEVNFDRHFLSVLIVEELGRVTFDEIQRLASYFELGDSHLRLMPNVVYTTRQDYYRELHGLKDDGYTPIGTTCFIADGRTVPDTRVPRFGPSIMYHSDICSADAVREEAVHYLHWFYSLTADQIEYYIEERSSEGYQAYWEPPLRYYNVEFDSESRLFVAKSFDHEKCENERARARGPTLSPDGILAKSVVREFLPAYLRNVSTHSDSSAEEFYGKYARSGIAGVCAELPEPQIAAVSKPALLHDALRVEGWEGMGRILLGWSGCASLAQLWENERSAEFLSHRLRGGYSFPHDLIHFLGECLARDISTLGRDDKTVRTVVRSLLKSDADPIMLINQLVGWVRNGEVDYNAA